jgi:hypothetical protein
MATTMATTMAMARRTMNASGLLDPVRAQARDHPGHGERESPRCRDRRRSAGVWQSTRAAPLIPR